MSNPVAQSAVMKLKNMLPELRKQGEVVAVFGQARLVKHMDCNYELVGGTPADRHDAREWISLFMHEVVLRNARN